MSVQLAGPRARIPHTPTVFDQNQRGLPAALLISGQIDAIRRIVVRISKGTQRMAMKTISARGQMNAGMAIEVECGNHRLIMDQPRNAAGQDLGPTPLEAITAAVAGCFGTIAALSRTSKNRIAWYAL